MESWSPSYEPLSNILDTTLVEEFEARAQVGRKRKLQLAQTTANPATTNSEDTAPAIASAHALPCSATASSAQPYVPSQSSSALLSPALSLPALAPATVRPLSTVPTAGTDTTIGVLSDVDDVAMEEVPPEKKPRAASPSAPADPIVDVIMKDSFPMCALVGSEAADVESSVTATRAGEAEETSFLTTMLQPANGESTEGTVVSSSAFVMVAPTSAGISSSSSLEIDMTSPKIPELIVGDESQLSSSSTAIAVQPLASPQPASTAVLGMPWISPAPHSHSLDPMDHDHESYAKVSW